MYSTYVLYTKWSEHFNDSQTEVHRKGIFRWDWVSQKWYFSRFGGMMSLFFVNFLNFYSAYSTFILSHSYSTFIRSSPTEKVTEQRIELMRAVQQAEAKPTELRRTLLFSILSYLFSL